VRIGCNKSVGVLEIKMQGLTEAARTRESEEGREKGDWYHMSNEEMAKKAELLLHRRIWL